MVPAQPDSQSSYSVRELINNPDTNLLESLICFKCKNIVSQPQQCQGCQQIACKDCLSHNSLVNEEIYCLSCKNFNQFVSIPKFIRKYLNTLQFTCINKHKGCNDIIPYQEIKTHQCKILCSHCELAYINQTHDCLEKVKTELMRIRKLKDVKEGAEERSKSKLKQQSEYLVLQGEDLDIFQKTHLIFARTPLKCDSGHQLELTKRKFERITCNFCNTVYPKRQYFWSCQKCMFDLCLDCEKPKKCAWDFISDYQTFMENVRKKNYYVVSSAGSKCVKCKHELRITLRGFREDDKKPKCIDCQSIKKGFFWYCEMCGGNFICLSCCPMSIFLDSDQVQA